MPRSLPDDLVFYPAYCFSLSPTFTTWARLTSDDVHALRERAGFEGQCLYFYLNHPIKWIRLVGVIVALDILDSRYVMVLDDSSGANIELTCMRKRDTAQKSGHADCMSTVLAKSPTPAIGSTTTGREIDLTGIDIGVVVKAKGGIGTFRAERQMLLERISIVQTTNEEVAAWDETTSFHRDVLDKAWIVSEKNERRARRKAEGSDRERKIREERRQQKQKQHETTRVQASKLAPKQSEMIDQVAKEQAQKRKEEEDCRSRQGEERERGKQRRDAERLERKHLVDRIAKEQQQRREKEEDECRSRQREEKEREKQRRAEISERERLIDQIAQEQQQKHEMEEESRLRQREEKERGKQRREVERLERERLFVERGLGHGN